MSIYGKNYKRLIKKKSANKTGGDQENPEQSSWGWRRQRTEGDERAETIEYYMTLKKNTSVELFTRNDFDFCKSQCMC